MESSFRCPHCKAKLKGIASREKRRCPNCAKPIQLRDYVNEEVPDPELPRHLLSYPPFVLLISACVLQSLAMVVFIDGSTFIGVILSTSGIGAAAFALMTSLDDRKKATSNFEIARRHFEAQRETKALFDGLKATFNETLSDHKERADQVIEKRTNESNSEIQMRWTALEREISRVEQMTAEAESHRVEIQGILDRLGKRLLNDSVKFISAKLTPNNFVASRDRLVSLVEFCRKHGFEVSSNDEQQLVADLRAQFELAVRSQFAREEQARIKAQIREEERIHREYEKELKQLETQREAIRKALEKAMQDAHGEHNAEVEELQRRLTEAEEKAERTKSMAELTKAGYVYVLSNIGAFGDGIFKVGMTRRLNPDERVAELSSASVPFPFDVHMMISCDNAPRLENSLHKKLDQYRVNRVNLRKEFFKVDIARIAAAVEENHGIVEYVADPEALQFRESISMDDEEFELMHRVLAEVEQQMGG